MSNMLMCRELPNLPDKIAFAKIITIIPILDKYGTLEERFLETEFILTDLFIGLPRHYYFFERFLLKMKHSYRKRTPEMLIQHLREDRHLSIDERISLMEDHIRNEPALFGTYLLGIAGCGKTTFLKLLRKLFPVKVDHPSISLVQVPILMVETPHKGSRIDLCKSIIIELSSVTKTDYVSLTKYLNETELTEKVRILILTHFVGTIILDECQDLKSAKTDPSDKTLNFIKYLTNKVGLPISFVGQLSAESLLFGNFQLSTRGQGYKWDRFKYRSPEWTLFIKTLFNVSVLRQQQDLSAELEFLYYDLTQGIPRMLTVLHAEAQKVALHNKREHLEAIDLLITAETLFTSTNYPIEGIRNYTVEILSKYSDLRAIKNFKKDDDPDVDVENEEKFVSDESDKKDAPSSIPTKMPSILLELNANVKTSNEMRTILMEHNIIKPISSIIEF